MKLAGSIIHTANKISSRLGARTEASETERGIWFRLLTAHNKRLRQETKSQRIAHPSELGFPYQKNDDSRSGWIFAPRLPGCEEEEEGDGEDDCEGRIPSRSAAC